MDADTSEVISELSRDGIKLLKDDRGVDDGLVTLVGWNIRAGGGVRGPHIANQLLSWGADVVALSEFRGTNASTMLAAALASNGLSFQLTTADPLLPARNALLLASRWPLYRFRTRDVPRPSHRCLPALLSAPTPFMLVAVHGPLGTTGLRRPFNQSLLAMVRRRRSIPGIVIGDTNTGRRGLDEQSPVFNAEDDDWMVAMGRSGWPDVFRHFHPAERAYTWFSPNRGNGFRLDQAFVQRRLIPQVGTVRYEWGRGERDSVRRDALSDHAALILELNGQRLSRDMRVRFG